MKKKNFRALEITAKKHLHTYSSGIHTTLLKDSLIEVDVVREYQPGDKRLDSRSSFKTGKLMSRVFNPDRSLSLFVILDLSSSSFSTLEESVITSLYLSYLADICNEKIGLCIFSDKVVYLLEPSEDYSYTSGCLEKSYNSFKLHASTAIDAAIQAVSNLSLNNALIVLISDFYYPINTKLSNSIKRFSAVETNKFLAVILADKRNWIDVKLPFNISFLDAENDSIVNFDLRKSLNYNDWSAGLKKALWSAGADTVFLNTAEERFLMPLVKYLMRTT